LAAIRNPARACRLQEADAAAAAESPTGWLAIVGFFVWLSIWAGGKSLIYTLETISLLVY
jgi:hypothetical protein